MGKKKAETEIQNPKSIIKRILIVDDRAEDLYLLETLLRKSGYEVVSAGNGVEALEKLRKDSIDMIISDILMPGMDGFRFCRECKKDAGLMRIPFVYCTATYTDKKDEEFALSLGAEKFFIKPLEPNDFLNTLKTIIEKYKNTAPATMKISVKDEEIYLAEYNKRLVKKLEEKVLDLEKETNAYRQAEKKIRLLSHAIEHSAATVVITDTEGNIEYANPKFTQLTGYSLEEAIGENPRIIKSGKTPPEVYKELWETITSGNEWRGEFCNRKKSGELYWESASISPVNNDKGNITHFIAVKEDVTERKRMEDSIIRTQKFESLGLLAGGIAHDFNNFLAIILGNIDLAKMYADPEDEIFNNLTTAEKASRQAEDLTRQLRSFSKSGTPVKETVSISEIINESVNLVLSGSVIRNELCLPEDTWLIDADKGRISQVISNLIINSVQAMPEGGIIKISTENINVTAKDPLPLSEGEYVKMTIEDQGTGIPREHLQEIFDPYYTTKENGSGLGLAITYSIIKKHNGHIAVESEISIGTKFYIYLPRASTPTDTDGDTD